MGQQLVAVADAQHRHALRHRIGQPPGGGLAPGRTVGDHGVRSRQHHAAAAGQQGGHGRQLAGIGAWVEGGDVQRQAAAVQPLGYPVFKVAQLGGEIGQGVAQLEDEDVCGRLHGGEISAEGALNRE